MLANRMLWFVAAVVGICVLLVVAFSERVKTPPDGFVRSEMDLVLEAHRCLPEDFQYSVPPREVLSWRVRATQSLYPIPITLDRNRPFSAEDRANVFITGRNLFAESMIGRERATHGGARLAKIVGEGTPSAQPCMPVQDLPASTIVFVETTGLNTNWMEAGDVEISSLAAASSHSVPKPIGSRAGDSFLVVFADHEAWRLKSSLPADLLLRFVTASRAEVSDRDELLSGYRVDLR